MAMAERFLSHRFNREGFPVVDYHVYGMVSDGDMMEGISSEAASLAGHLGLGKLVYIYLDNRISIDGPTSLTFREDVALRFDAYQWQVLRVDGYDLKGIEGTLNAARADLVRPSLIIARTHIGYGSPNKQDSAEAHGAPLGKEEVLLTKRNLGWPEEPEFLVPQDVLAHFRKAVETGEASEKAWLALWERYAKGFPERAREWEHMRKRPDAAHWKSALPRFEPGQGGVATRAASGKVLNALVPHLPGLVGGSADLTPSNNTYLKGLEEFQETSGPNVHFGVREHAMGAILNGMALSGALIPYGGTFLIFSDYMRPAIRLAALMEIPVIYVFTHDSVGLGEDGPTHQPVEHLMSLRAMPNLWVIRPADANETVEAWRLALQRRDGPTALILSRQNLPVIDRTSHAPANGLRRGAYVLADGSGGEPDLLLLGTGAEVHLLLAARDELQGKGLRVRVVNMACWELFDMQPPEYREEILPIYARARLAVEAGASQGWERYTGLDGLVLGLDRFGASAPAKALFEHLGFTAENVVRAAQELLARTR
jgi:transketolase